MISSQVTASLLVLVAVSSVCARPSDYPLDEQISAVIPSPNQYMEDQATSATKVSSALPVASLNSPGVPIYVSPYVRSERGVRQVPETTLDTSANFAHDEPSVSADQAAPAPQPQEEISYIPAKPSGRDLKPSASYGHGHQGDDDHHHGGGHGWLDMGAWTGGKGSFGWYADYPVGKKHGGHH